MVDMKKLQEESKDWSPKEIHENLPIQSKLNPYKTQVGRLKKMLESLDTFENNLASMGALYNDYGKSMHESYCIEIFKCEQILRELVETFRSSMMDRGTTIEKTD